MSSPLPPPRVVVTEVTPAGLSVIKYDRSSHNIWGALESPINNQIKEDRAGLTKNIVIPGGHNSCYVDFSPNGEISSLHFTHSLDYGVVITGQIEAIMSDGSITTLKAGDVIVQRGTNHAWKNSTSEWTRVLFIVISAQEVLIDGKKMEGLHLP